MGGNSIVQVETRDKSWLYYFLFFVSGMPALIYQIVWQRALFTLYGINIESVTIIVTVFMLGLGLGSLAGGWLSNRPRIRLLRAFGSIEISVGVFGAVSLWIFHFVASHTAGSSIAVTGLVAFALLLIPTLLMGSTLPLLVEHFVRRTGNVGESLGLLYSVNTLGSGLACLACAFFIMRVFGEAGSVRLAASLNLLVGLSAVMLQSKVGTPARPLQSSQSEKSRQTIPFSIGMFLAGATGFIALAYEIVWYRLYMFTTGGTAACFPELLAFYLFGIAYGSFAVRDSCRKVLGNDVRRTLSATCQVVLLGAIVAFLLGPILGLLVVHIPYGPTYSLVFIATALLGAAFPLLAHAAVDPAQGPGKHVSLLYLSNIIGSTLGSYFIGFIMLDHWSTRVTSTFLLSLGVFVAAVLAFLSRIHRTRRIFIAGCTACILFLALSGPLFSSMFERLLYKTYYRKGTHFASLVENRSGVIAVDASGIVYGGGAYDGRFSVDLVDDSSMLFRAFAVAGFNRKPKSILVIGLSSGSWAQVLANDPDVESETIVEINPGYLPLIRKHPIVSSLLDNPKVHIVIDDGRRWLVGHPNSRFDLILMNTTWNWRANISNLLSKEFQALVKEHLNPGGVSYYNTTWSDRVQATGIAAFPYALRLSNFLAVSDEPITLDKDAWRTALINYKIDGKPVFDLSDPFNRTRIQQVLSLADEMDGPGGRLESRSSLQRRLKDTREITDDNMGTEWQ
jgi:spermidine synthase